MAYTINSAVVFLLYKKINSPFEPLQFRNDHGIGSSQ